jgi:hypothetical protein
MRHEGSIYDSMKPAPIGELAKWSYTEGEKTPLQRQRWRPREMPVAACPEREKSGVDEVAATHLPAGPGIASTANRHQAAGHEADGAVSWVPVGRPPRCVGLDGSLVAGEHVDRDGPERLIQVARNAVQFVRLDFPTRDFAEAARAALADEKRIVQQVLYCRGIALGLPVDLGRRDAPREGAAEQRQTRHELAFDDARREALAQPARISSPRTTR